jgi:hypothetical protein
MPNRIALLILTLVLGSALPPATSVLFAQGLGDLGPPIPVSESVCTRFVELADNKSGVAATPLSPTAAHALQSARLTDYVANALPPLPGGGRTGISQNLANAGLIDQFIFGALQDAGVQPADPTTDWEFIRRITLDLTGRIPDPSRVLSFVASTDPNKRTALVDELIARPEWLDKWTMFFGDLYKNNSSNSQIQRFRPGVQAFHDYIRTSLLSGKPYDQMSRDLITATGTSSYNTGELNFVAGGVVTGGPTQDIYDQQTANIVDTFLGVSHLNCLLCHNGRGHLDNLTLWGAQQTRVRAWGMASFLSHTSTSRTRVDQASVNPYYWGIADLPAAKDYALNTTTGNRPARQPIGSVSTVSPAYMFGDSPGEQPKAGENYRVALARIITADPQFARATVNYMWAYFFGVGLVDPPDQFDPLRLDPDNPPPAPWTLQPSNPRLLNALAKAFVANGYDLKWLMRQIVNSGAYQLSSRYDGQWNDAWAGLYARKFVRRLWAEEVHDAVAVSSNSIPSYALTTYGTLGYAMQFPETVGLPDGNNGNISGFLDAFLRGNRDDQPRSDEGSIQQALNLMNDSFVINRTQPAPQGILLQTVLSMPDQQMVDTLFLKVLSRHPNATELSIALKNLAPPANRTAEAQNLTWSLYNKVDFVFNY